MSGQADMKIQLTDEDARSLTQPTLVDVVRKDTGEVVESVTILRYAGHYRSGSVHAYAVKDAKGKFRVRGEFALGLNEASPFAAYLSAGKSQLIA